MRPATPRHNGKVERSHREDQKRFYDKAAFYSLEDASSQIEKYLNKSNNRPTRPLGYLSPIQGFLPIRSLCDTSLTNLQCFILFLFLK
ncbi:transposase [Longicatena sp. 210702-DFI.1.194]|nr:transposase [Longicatena caecimuris]MCB6432607.1 transposase [Longicatena sp. 210702-DFI.1.249]MCB7226448.1 transposase [Longicatena sp. 210702-DFI.1.211]MCB7243892.1 transposase [Longicatena sp. 210702-DFI.1.196]MCB7257715.1 transposase [Longicatena sp. 210702-DFI.1.177]MCB7269024.1 transposase [Longicatena sp. 210702-DFI.1.194]